MQGYYHRGRGKNGGRKEEIATESIIDGIKEYIAGCPLLAEIKSKNRHIDWTEEPPDDNYGIMTDGDDLIKGTVRGGGEYQYSFALYVRKMAADDFQRLNNMRFMEKLKEWCRNQSRTRKFPELPDGCQALRFTAEKDMLLEISPLKKSGTYQIQFKLNYYRK